MATYSASGLAARFGRVGFGVGVGRSSTPRVVAPALVATPLPLHRHLALPADTMTGKIAGELRLPR